MKSCAGLGDRHQQIVEGVTTNYTLDLAAGLTQVLEDGTNTYLYGNGRISQSQITNPQSPEYFLGDALGSVRQLADPAGAVTLTQSYAPYGDVVSSVGTSQTSYAFTGEALDANGLTFLRARYYAPQDGRFISRDTWAGVYERPLSLNRWSYVEGSPILLTDPSGNNPIIAAAIPVLIGGGVGFVGGAAIGAGFGCLTYEWALTGECGCEMQQQAIAMGSKADWVAMHALTGGIIGGVAGAIASTGPAGMIVVGGAGVVFAGADIVRTINIVRNETGWTKCTIARISLDVAITVLGTAGFVKGIRAWRTNGSRLFWLTGRSGYSGPPEGWQNIKPSDLKSGYNGIRLSDAIASGEYRPPSNLIGGSSNLRGTAKFIYVIGENGTIWVTREIGTYHHPDLVNGGNVFGAGEMYINQQGKIVLINNQSGHYLPQGPMFFGYLRYLLNNLGVDVLPNAIP